MEAELQSKINGLNHQIELLSNKRNTIIEVNRTAKSALEVFDDLLHKPKICLLYTSKSLLSSGFKPILLPMRIVSLYQCNGLYFASPSMRQDMAMLFIISVILVCCIFGIVSNSQINRISTAR